MPAKKIKQSIKDEELLKRYNAARPSRVTETLAESAPNNDKPSTVFVGPGLGLGLYPYKVVRCMPKLPVDIILFRESNKYALILTWWLVQTGVDKPVLFDTCEEAAEAAETIAGLLTTEAWLAYHSEPLPHHLTTLFEEVRDYERKFRAKYIAAA